MMEYLDEEEKEIIESLHSEDWIPNPDKKVNKRYEKIARNTLEFNNKVEIKLTTRDFNRIQIKALEEGIPYQFLISMLIHQYNEGKFAIQI